MGMTARIPLCYRIQGANPGSLLEIFGLGVSVGHQTFISSFIFRYCAWGQGTVVSMFRSSVHSPDNLVVSPILLL
jgi:hypothetical protein